MEKKKCGESECLLTGINIYNNFIHKISPSERLNFVIKQFNKLILKHYVMLYMDSVWNVTSAFFFFLLWIISRFGRVKLEGKQPCNKFTKWDYRRRTQWRRKKSTSYLPGLEIYWCAFLVAYLRLEMLYGGNNWELSTFQIMP